MATKAKKKSSAKKPAPETAKPSPAVKKDPRTLNREIGNALFTDEERAGIFFAKHWKKLIAAALIAVVAVTGIFAYLRHRKSVREAATARLDQAKTLAAIDAELAKNAKVPGIDRARFRKAQLLTEAKKYGEAIKVLEELVSTSEDAANRSRATLQIAYLLECDNKPVEAVKGFSDLVGNAAVPVDIRAEAAYAAARLYIDRKNPAEAKKVLGTLKAMKVDPNTHPGAVPWLERARALENSIN